MKLEKRLETLYNVKLPNSVRTRETFKILLDPVFPFRYPS